MSFKDGIPNIDITVPLGNHPRHPERAPYEQDPLLSLLERPLKRKQRVK